MNFLISLRNSSISSTVTNSDPFETAIQSLANILVIPFYSLSCEHSGFLGRFVVNGLMKSFRIEPHFLTAAALFLSEHRLSDLKFISQSQWTDYKINYGKLLKSA
jgi:hypothetical protein